jgi:hypothetical protein
MDTQRGDQSTQSAGLMFVGNLGRSWVGAWACACGKANVTVRFLLSDRAVTLPLLIRYVSEDEIVAGVQRSFLRACLVSSNCAEFNWIPESTLFGSLWNQTTNFNWFPTGRICSPPRILKKNVGNLRILNAITMQSLVPDSVPFPTPPTVPTDPRRHPPLSTQRYHLPPETKKNGCCHPPSLARAASPSTENRWTYFPRPDPTQHCLPPPHQGCRAQRHTRLTLAQPLVKQSRSTDQTIFTIYSH